MTFHPPLRNVLILVATALLVTGCALKPRAASRFSKQVSADGQCNCYTCRQKAAAAHPTPTLAQAAPVAQSHVGCSSCNAAAEAVGSPCESCNSGVLSAAPCESCNTGTCDSCNSFEGQSFEGYETVTPDSSVVPTPAEPFGEFTAANPGVNRVESLNQESQPQADQEMPVVEEISPSDRIDSLDFDASPSDEPALDQSSGGSFKPFGSSEEIVVAPKESSSEILAPPSDPIDLTPEPTPAKPLELMEVTKAETPVKVPTPAKVEAPKPTPVAVEVPKPAPVAVEVPKPTPVAIEIPKAKTITVPKPTTTIEVPAPASSFKPGEPFKPRNRNKTSSNTSANTNGKVVLRANQVEKISAATPGASQGTVPALQANFRGADHHQNWLRENQAVARQASANTVYESTPAATIATEPEPVRTAANPVYQKLPRAQQAKPQPKAVVLKAIPLKPSTGFTVPAPAANVVVSKNVEPSPVFVQPAPQQRIVVQEQQITEPIEIAAPQQTKPTHPQTARSIEDGEYVTPPWRIK